MTVIIISLMVEQKTVVIIKSIQTHKRVVIIKIIKKQNLMEQTKELQLERFSFIGTFYRISIKIFLEEQIKIKCFKNIFKINH